MFFNMLSVPPRKSLWEFSSRWKNLDCVLGFHRSALEFSQTFALVFTRLWRHGKHVLFLKYIISGKTSIWILCFMQSWHTLLVHEWKWRTLIRFLCSVAIRIYLNCIERSFLIIWLKMETWVVNKTKFFCFCLFALTIYHLVSKTKTH